MKSLRIWLLGVAAVFISGGASWVVAGVTATGIDPGSFSPKDVRYPSRLL